MRGVNEAISFVSRAVDAAGYTNGFTMRINRNRFYNKVNIPSDYLAGYLRIAN